MSTIGAKLALVGDNPGVKSLAWHSVVALLGTAPPIKCVNHKFINTQIPERFTRCSVHSLQRVAIRNKSGKTHQRKSNGWPKSHISYKMHRQNIQNIAAVCKETRSTTCTPFSKLSTRCKSISPPLKIPRSCCPTPESFECGPALHYIPVLRKFPLTHSQERIAVSSFNIFDIQLDMSLCKECDNTY